MNQQEYAERYGHDDNAHIKAWRETDDYKLFRPFRFEDLNGAPDPKRLKRRFMGSALS